MISKRTFIVFCTIFSYFSFANIVQIKQSYKESPIEASLSLQKEKDSDEKFILLFKIDNIIGERAHFSSKFKFGEKDQKRHLDYIKQFQNSNNGLNYRFLYYEPGGLYHSSRYWLSKLKNKQHNLLGDFDLERIRGIPDGCPDVTQDDVRKWTIKYKEWLDNYPTHPKVKKVKLIIKHLKPSQGC